MNANLFCIICGAEHDWTECPGLENRDDNEDPDDSDAAAQRSADRYALDGEEDD